MKETNGNVGPPVYGYPEIAKQNLRLIYDIEKEMVKDNLKARRAYFTQQLLQGADGVLWVLIQQHGVPDCIRLDAMNVHSELLYPIEGEGKNGILRVSLWHRGKERKLYMEEDRIGEKGYDSRAFKRANVNFAMKAKADVEELIVNWARDAAVRKKIPERRGWYYDGTGWDYAEKEDDTAKGVQRWM